MTYEKLINLKVGTKFICGLNLYVKIADDFIVDINSGQTKSIIYLAYNEYLKIYDKDAIEFGISNLNWSNK